MEKILKIYFKGLPFSLKDFIESKTFERFIVIIITLNAITLGLETHPYLSHGAHQSLKIIDGIFLKIFVLELILKFFVYKRRFFHDPWRIFDFIIVGVACLPQTGPFSIIRSLRVLRALRMISIIPSLKKVVNGLLSAIPGLSAVLFIICIVFYVSAVMATKLFGHEFSEWFGSIGKSFYSLFQIMTLESWSMGIVRPVMEKFPYAWLFFLPFILITTFTMLNLFIAVIVNAMQIETDETAEVRAEVGIKERHEIMDELSIIKEKLTQIEKNR